MVIAHWHRFIFFFLVPFNCGHFDQQVDAHKPSNYTLSSHRLPTFIRLIFVIFHIFYISLKLCWFAQKLIILYSLQLNKQTTNKDKTINIYIN